MKAVVPLKCVEPGGARARAFTLIELLVAIALIAALAAFLLGAGGLGGSKGASLQSGQSMLANLVVAARTRAMASGQNARLLVNISPTGTLAAERYLRYLVLQTYDAGSDSWNTVSDAYLPPGVYLVPRDPTAVAGLLPAEGSWLRPSDSSTLRSTALRASAELPSLAINSTEAEAWGAVNFTPSGTTATSGDLVLAIARPTPENATSPFQFESVELVRGLSLSTYGVPALVNGRESF